MFNLDMLTSYQLLVQLSCSNLHCSRVCRPWDQHTCSLGRGRQCTSYHQVGLSQIFRSGVHLRTQLYTSC